MEGWNGTLTFSLGDQVGVSFQSAGHYYGGTHNFACGDGSIPCRIQRDSYDILVGPVFRPAFLRKYRLRPFVQGMVGAVYLSGTSFDYVPAFEQTVRLHSRELTPAVGIGAGIDIAVAERLHIRLIQLDYVRQYGSRLWWFPEAMARPSTGLVVRF